MIRLNSTIPNHDRIRNIIFDFGNVVCDIDVSLTEAKFREFGPARSSANKGDTDTGSDFDAVVELYEAGKISSEAFRTIIREHYIKPPTDTDIDEAWNALVLPIPERRIGLLNEIRPVYRIFLLSNSNEIHYFHYLVDFQQKTGMKDFDDLFVKAYFSFQAKISKPDPAIFNLVLRENNLDPLETLFIDDTQKHITAARTTGINAFLLQNGTDICSLFG